MTKGNPTYQASQTSAYLQETQGLFNPLGPCPDQFNHMRPAQMGRPNYRDYVDVETAFWHGQGAALIHEDRPAMEHDVCCAGAEPAEDLYFKNSHVFGEELVIPSPVNSEWQLSEKSGAETPGLVSQLVHREQIAKAASERVGKLNAMTEAIAEQARRIKEQRA